MTREQIKAMLPDGTEDAVVTRILDALHSELTPYKDAVQKAKDEHAKALAEKDDALKALQTKYDADMKAANEKAEGALFDAGLDGALREHGARNIKAARALLDIEKLRTSEQRDADIKAAIEALVSGEDSAFLFGARPTGGKENVGSGTGGTGSQMDGVEAAFRAKNPNMKLD